MKKDKKLIKKAVEQHEKAKHPNKVLTVLKLKKGGKVKKK